MIEFLFPFYLSQLSPNNLIKIIANEYEKLVWYTKKYVDGWFIVRRYG